MNRPKLLYAINFTLFDSLFMNLGFIIRVILIIKAFFINGLAELLLNLNLKKIVTVMRREFNLSSKIIFKRKNFLKSTN